MKKGFTLIELSIVLVIIGLLIGGILVAQSMIKTAQIQAFIRQIGQYDAAVESFKTTYRRLPGDNTYFGSVGVSLDDTISDVGGGTSQFNGEIGRFWSDLAAAGLRNEDGAPYTTGAGVITPGGNVPRYKLSKTAGIVGWGTLNQNFYTVSNFAVGGASVVIGGVIPLDGLTIDRKIDDGGYLTGNVIIHDCTTNGYYIGSCGSPNNTCRSAFALLIDTPTEACSMKIRMGTSIGVLE